MDKVKIAELSALFLRIAVIFEEMAEEQFAVEQKVEERTAKDSEINNPVNVRKTPEGLYTMTEIAAEFGLSVNAANKMLKSAKKATVVGGKVCPDPQLFYDQLCCKKKRAYYWTEKGREWVREFLRKRV